MDASVYPWIGLRLKLLKREFYKLLKPQKPQLKQSNSKFSGLKYNCIPFEVITCHAYVYIYSA